MADRFIYPCPKCKRMSANPLTCTSCGVIFEKFKAQQLRPMPSASGVRGEEPGRIGFRSLKVNLWALPVCFVGVWVVGLIPLFRAILFTFGQIPFHELGHAMAAWFAGTWAVPLGVIVPFAAFTYMGEEKSVLFQLLFQGGLIWLALKAHQRGRPHLAKIWMGVALVAIGVGWGMSWERTRMYFYYGGLGGEFLLSTLLICLFYYRVSERLRWDFFRFPALLLGVSCFTSSFEMWRRIAAGAQPLPRGTMLVGRTDSNGDIDRLLGEFQWTEPELIGHFNRLGFLCLLVIAIHYLIAALRSKGRS